MAAVVLVSVMVKLPGLTFELVSSSIPDADDNQVDDSDLIFTGNGDDDNHDAGGGYNADSDDDDLEEYLT